MEDFDTQTAMSENDKYAATVYPEPLPSTRAKKPQLPAYGDLTTIEAGGEGKGKALIFHVHKGLLSFYSGYFRAALGGSWKESTSGIIKLHTENTLVFARFVLWLYTNKVTDDTLKSDSNMIIQLWLFADRRNIPLLMNEMVDALHESIVATWCMPTSSMNEVYESTSEGSALRRMLVWSMSRTLGKEHFATKAQAEQWPYDALMEMLRLTLTDRSLPTLSEEQYKKVKMCPTYHVHEEGVSCTDEKCK